MVHGCCSSPKPAPHGKTVNVHPVGRIGRYEGTAMFLGRREHTESSLQSAFIRRENLNTCVVPPRCRRTSIRKPRQDTVPRADYAGNKKAEKKPKKPLSGEVSPLTTWGLIRVRHCGHHHSVSHSSRSIWACRNILAKSSRPMSPRWGLGIQRVMSPLTINWCLPPEYGPSNPTCWRERIKSRRLSGPNRGTTQLPSL